MGSGTPAVSHSVCVKPATPGRVCVSTGSCCWPAWPLRRAASQALEQWEWGLLLLWSLLG